MNRFVLSVTLCLLLFGSFAGCSSRIGEFTFLSTKAYDRQVQYKMIGRMEGTDTRFMILIPLSKPSLQTAIDRCIDAGGGVYLANAVVQSTVWWAVVGQVGYTVVGDVYAPATHSDLVSPVIEKFVFEAGNLVSTKSGTSMPVASR